MSKILELARELDMETMYNMISRAVVDDDSLEEEALKITHGRNNIHIAYYIDENHKSMVVRKGHKVIIRQNPQLIFTITQWFEEKQYRKALMLKFIETHLGEEEVTSAQ